MPKAPFAHWRIIVKRFFSLLIALVLLVSMFALPVFAFAAEATPDTEEGKDEATKREPLSLVAADFIAKFKELVLDANKGLYVEMNTEFKLNQEWLDDVKKVHDLFPGINYIVLPDEDFEDADEDHKITYSMGNTEEGTNHAKNKDSKPADGTYKESQHVTLPSAYEAEEGYEFGGWLLPVAYDGGAVGDDGILLGETKYYLYRAGDKFAMPGKDIQALAYWYQKETTDDPDKDTDGEEGAAAVAEEKYDYTYPANDIICIEYCSPSDEPKDEHWSRKVATESISLQTAGWWLLRYVVVDGESSIDDDDAVITSFNGEDFKEALLDKDKNVYDWGQIALYRYAVDTKNPEITLSESMKTTMKDGLKVGTNYTIPTSLTITDSSSTSVTYVVYRYDGANGFDTAAGATNKGEWVAIYDSAADVKILEGGEDYFSASGVIKPIAADVTDNANLYRYKVVYSVKDANGYFGIAKEENDENGFTDESGFHPTLYLGVQFSKQDAETKAKIEAWKIVLYVIAGLSAIGIVVLLFIKPKQALEGDARVSDANVQDYASDVSDAPTDDTPEGTDESQE